MKNIKKILWLLLVLSVLLSFVSCSSNVENTYDNTITITDTAGRHVAVKRNCDSAVCIGPGALRLYCYVNGSNKIKGIERTEKENNSGRPYILANPDLKELDIIGEGGSNNSPDSEKILAKKPDVIFSTYSDADGLQEKTGIPVIALNYGDHSIFDQNIYDSINLIGKIMNKKARATEVVDFMENCQKDLLERTKNIEKKPKIYVAAISFKGCHGIEGTHGKNPLYESIHAVNVADETNKKGPIIVDREQILNWDPDIIFLDYAGLDYVKEDFKKNQEYYENLKAFEDGNTYFLHPYNHYFCNIDIALTDAYFMGSVIYPEKFKDIDIKKKADEIYHFLLGKDLYEKMCSDYGELKKGTVGKFD